MDTTTVYFVGALPHVGNTGSSASPLPCSWVRLILTPQQPGLLMLTSSSSPGMGKETWASDRHQALE